MHIYWNAPRAPERLRKEILNEVGPGVPASEIARKHGLARSTIYNIINEAKDPVGQGRKAGGLLKDKRRVALHA